MHVILQLLCMVEDVMCSRGKVMRISGGVPTLLCVILVQDWQVPWILSPLLFWMLNELSKLKRERVVLLLLFRTVFSGLD